MEFDQDKFVKEASEEIRPRVERGLRILELYFLGQLISQAYRLLPDDLELSKEEAENLVDALIEINKDLLPRSYEVLHKQKQEKLDNPGREILP